MSEGMGGFGPVGGRPSAGSGGSPGGAPAYSRADLPASAPGLPGAVVQPRLGRDEKETLLVYLLRREAVFHEARRHLLPEHWSVPGEEPFAAVWRIVLDYYAEHQRMPLTPALAAGLAAVAERVPGRLTPELLAPFLPPGLLFWAFTVDVAVLPDEYGYQLLRRLLRERAVVDPLREFWLSVGGGIPADLPGLLADFGKKVEAVDGVARGSIRRAGLSRQGAPPRTPQSTGFPCLDRVMEGGRSEGEIVMLYGVSGGGKTRLLSCLSAHAARQESLRALAAGEQPRNVCYFTYETPAYEVEDNALSSLARIRGAHLAARDSAPGGSCSNLSSVRQGRPLHHYENSGRVQGGVQYPDLPADERPPLRGELERLEQVLPLFTNWGVFDMKGSRDEPAAGSGGVLEIRTRLQRTTDESGVGHTLVVIDFAQFVVERLLAAKNWDPDRNKRHLLNSFCNDVQRELIVPFGCTVLVSVQLNGAANARPPGTRVTPEDCAECHTMHIPADWTFQLGKGDWSKRDGRRVGLVALWTGKTRHAPGSSEPATILEFNQDWCDFIECPGLVARGGRIVEAGWTSGLAPPSALALPTDQLDAAEYLGPVEEPSVPTTRPEAPGD